MHNTIDLQQIFDHVVVSVIAQGALSVSEAGACVNLGPDGRKCGAAHGLALLGLSDEQLAKGDLTNLSLRASLFELCQTAAPEREDVYRLLLALRDAHDNAAGASDWRRQFVEYAESVACDFKLSADKVEEAAKAAGWIS